MGIFYNGKWIDPEYKGEYEIAGPKTMQFLKNKLEKYAPKPFKVLILGESGTGKELIAHYIHNNSQRHKKNFVTVNIASLPESLFESELFGHEKNAFTGAAQKKEGLLEIANNGTVFFDEIGDLRANLQASLLRFLQNGEIKTVGNSEVKKIDTRIISATNIDIEESLRTGKLRNDLIQRLRELTIETKPLRELREDIPFLLGYFINKYKEYASEKITCIDAPIVHFLSELEWYGNFRQLENAVKQFVVLGEPIELIPKENHDFFKFINDTIGKKSLDHNLRVAGYNYVRIAKSVAEKNGTNGLDDLLLINNEMIDTILKKNEGLKYPFFYYPGLQTQFMDYISQKKSLSYVLTRFARTYLGIMVEDQINYPEITKLTAQDGDTVAKFDLQNAFKKINTRINFTTLEHVYYNYQDLKASDLNYRNQAIGQTSDESE